MAKDDDGPRSSTRPILRSCKDARSSDEARARKKERLKEAYLEDVPRDAGAERLYYRAGEPYVISQPEDLLALLMLLRC